MITTINEMKKKLDKKSKPKMIKESLSMEQVFKPEGVSYTVSEIVDAYIEYYDNNISNDDESIDHQFILDNLTEQNCQDYVDYINIEDNDESVDQLIEFFFVELGLMDDEE